MRNKKITLSDPVQVRNLQMIYMPGPEFDSAPPVEALKYIMRPARGRGAYARNF